MLDLLHFRRKNIEGVFEQTGEDELGGDWVELHI
jgi:hypothetical protein